MKPPATTKDVLRLLHVIGNGNKAEARASVAWLRGLLASGWEYECANRSLLNGERVIANAMVMRTLRKCAGLPEISPVLS